MSRPLLAEPRRASDEELLAAMLGTVSPDNVRRARGLLEQVGGYQALPAATLRELLVCEGVGAATATRIKAAVEMGRRSLARPLERGTPVSCSRDVFETVGTEMGDAEQETFKVLVLDARHCVIRTVEVSKGSIDSTLVHPREVFRAAIKEGASAVIVIHNHPSGHPLPSAEDRTVTRRLRAAGDLVGIDLLDHVIVARGTYFSFRDEGEL